MRSVRPRRAPRPSRAARFAMLGFGLAIAALLAFAADAVFDLRSRTSQSTDPVIAAWERDREFFRVDAPHLVANHPNMPPARFPAAKPDGELRVVVLGGSQAMGDPYVHGRRVVEGRDLDELNITNSGGIATWLEPYLAKLYPDRVVRVVNAAMGDQNLTTVAAAFEELVAKSELDLAVVLAGNNEIYQADFPSAAARDAALEELTARFASQLERIAKLAERHRIATYLLTVPTNVRDWLPSFGHQPIAKAELDRLLDAAPGEVPEATLAALREAGHALHDFFVAREHAAAGRPDSAYTSYTAAKDRDYNLIRTHSRWNDLVRAGAGPYVHVFDLEQALRRHAAERIPGYDLFHDHCHMKLRTNVIVAAEIARFHQKTAGLPDDPLPEVNLSARLRSQLASLYAIKQHKWERIGEASEFQALGDRNKANVAKQFEAEKLALESVTRAIDPSAADVPGDAQNAR